MFLGRFFRRFRPVGSHKRVVKLMETRHTISIVMLLIFVVFEIFIFSIIAGRFMGDDNSLKVSHQKNIAVLNIDEEITSKYIARIIDKLEKVRQNPATFSHLLVVMNSGGGSPTASDELRHYLEDLQQSGIGLSVYIESMCASGAYYIATASKYNQEDALSGIIANQNALVGSIGVIISYPVVQEAAKKLGIAHQSITVGKHKEPISMFKEPTKEDIAYLKTQWMQPVYENFMGMVAVGRQMSLEELQQYADGKVYVANQIEGVLVDRISYLHAIKQELKQKYQAIHGIKDIGFVAIDTKEKPQSILNGALDIHINPKELTSSSIQMR